MVSRILRPGRTAWRLEHAGRAAVLIDAAAFFAAVRAACLEARRRIIIVGWDIDSRTKLVGDSAVHDGLPIDFRDFLAALVTRRPELRVDLLLWDYSLLYAHERELLPQLSLQWQTPPQVTLCLDASVPFGSSQHQKIVVVDDALAFSGGLDITIRRWDTSRHEADEPRRLDPAGEPYRPFHDVQMMVDGDAAGALALLARTRWCRAEGGAPAIEPCGDPWPDGVRPDFHDVEVGIARTQPRYRDEPEIQEVRSNDWFWVGSVRRNLARVLPGCSRHRTFPAAFPLFALDGIYLWPAGLLVASRTDPEARVLSDHLPVIADIDLGRAGV